MRAVVACGWFGIQAWIGGEALHTFFSALVPAWPSLLVQVSGGHTTTAWLVVWLFLEPQHLHHLPWHEPVAKGGELGRALRVVMTAVLLVWAVREAMVSEPRQRPGKFQSFSEFHAGVRAIAHSHDRLLGDVVAQHARFTRFGRGQREQCSDRSWRCRRRCRSSRHGRLDHDASEIIYGQAIWDPVQLVARFETPFVVAISMFTAVVATLAVNIAANVVSPANDFANAFPRFIRFRTGGLLTGILGLLMQPWRLLADPTGYIFTWLLGYSGGWGRSPVC